MALASFASSSQCLGCGRYRLARIREKDPQYDEDADTSPVSFVVVVGKDGHVLRLYVEHETNTFACVRQTLQQGKFPAPPHFPYYMHISMSFQETNSVKTRRVLVNASVLSEARIRAGSELGRDALARVR